MVELRKIAERPEGEASGEDFDNFASLMRFSYNDRHLELMGWAENMASLGREAQKRFFRYAVSLLRESYMLSAGMGNISYLWGREREFCESSPLS